MCDKSETRTPLWCSSRTSCKIAKPQDGIPVLSLASKGPEAFRTRTMRMLFETRPSQGSETHVCWRIRQRTTSRTCPYSSLMSSQFLRIRRCLRSSSASCETVSSLPPTMVTRTPRRRSRESARRRKKCAFRASDFSLPIATERLRPGKFLALATWNVCACVRVLVP